MSTKINRPDIEDFWKDCIKFELPKKNKKPNKSRLTIIESNSCMNFNNLNINNNDHGHRNKNKNLKKHKLLYKILTTEESIPKNIKKNKEKQIAILTSLYNKDISDKKRIQEELTRIREKKEKEELQNCTFKPQNKYRNYRNNKSYDETYKKKFGKKNIYERVCVYKKKYNKKIAELKKEEAMEEKQEFENYPFMPTIRQKNLKKVFLSNNYWEKIANNYSKKAFLYRYKNARKDESDKKKRLIWSMDKNNNDFNYDNTSDKNKINNYRNIHRSISQKDSLLYKQSLHFSLLDFKTNNDNNNNENVIIN